MAAVLRHCPMHTRAHVHPNAVTPTATHTHSHLLSATPSSASLPAPTPWLSGLPGPTTSELATSPWEPSPAGASPPVPHGCAPLAGPETSAFELKPLSESLTASVLRADREKASLRSADDDGCSDAASVAGPELRAPMAARRTTSATAWTARRVSLAPGRRAPCRVTTGNGAARQHSVEGTSGTAGAKAGLPWQ